VELLEEVFFEKRDASPEGFGGTMGATLILRPIDEVV